eukprot:scaffold123238_cov24-Tisochrysis_lutea.AAC.2
MRVDARVQRNQIAHSGQPLHDVHPPRKPYPPTRATALAGARHACSAGVAGRVGEVYVDGILRWAPHTPRARVPERYLCHFG